MSLTKCDHPDCDEEITHYGYMHCFQCCDEHADWGQEIENNLFKEIARANRFD